MLSEKSQGLAMDLKKMDLQKENLQEKYDTILSEFQELKRNSLNTQVRPPSAAT